MGGISVQTKGIEHVFDGGVRALKPTNMSVEPGRIHVLLGPSGCGKTTLLRILAGLIRPTAGSIIVGDKDVTQTPTERRGLVLLHQDQLLFPNMSVVDNVAYPLRARGIARRDARLQANKTLEQVQLDGLASRRPDALSGGQRQRVALARALCARPRVLLLDEPRSMLDAGLRDAMRELIIKVQRTSSLTMLVVTHDQREATALADRVSIMMKGEIVREDSPDGLYRDPTYVKVARFLGATNILNASVDGSVAVTELGPLDLAHVPQSAANKVCIWPQDIELGPGPNSLSTRVEESVFSGSERRLRLSASGITLEVVAPRWSQIEVGHELIVHLPPERVHALVARHEEQ